MNDPAAEALFDALEAQGILGQIRAMLRTAVFTSVDEHEREAGTYVHNVKALQMMRSTDGKLALQLIYDFLAHFELDQTLSVLRAETGLADAELMPIPALAAKVLGADGSLPQQASSSRPLLLQLLDRTTPASGKAISKSDTWQAGSRSTHRPSAYSPERSPRSASSPQDGDRVEAGLRARVRAISPTHAASAAESASAKRENWREEVPAKNSQDELWEGGEEATEPLFDSLYAASANNGEPAAATEQPVSQHEQQQAEPRQHVPEAELQPASTAAEEAAEEIADDESELLSATENPAAAAADDSDADGDDVFDDSAHEPHTQQQQQQHQQNSDEGSSSRRNSAQEWEGGDEAPEADYSDVLDDDAVAFSNGAARSSITVADAAAGAARATDAANMAAAGNSGSLKPLSSMAIGPRGRKGLRGDSTLSDFTVTKRFTTGVYSAAAAAAAGDDADDDASDQQQHDALNDTGDWPSDYDTESAAAAAAIENGADADAHDVDDDGSHEYVDNEDDISVDQTDAAAAEEDEERKLQQVEEQLRQMEATDPSLIQQRPQLTALATVAASQQQQQQQQRSSPARSSLPNITLPAVAAATTAAASPLGEQHSSASEISDGEYDAERHNIISSNEGDADIDFLSPASSVGRGASSSNNNNKGGRHGGFSSSNSEDFEDDAAATTAASTGTTAGHGFEVMGREPELASASPQALISALAAGSSSSGTTAFDTDRTYECVQAVLPP